MTLEEAKAKLLLLEADPSMNTDGHYSPSAAGQPGSKMPFCETHLTYLEKNKSVNPAHYISNLELMIKIR